MAEALLVEMADRVGGGWGMNNKQILGVWVPEHYRMGGVLFFSDQSLLVTICVPVPLSSPVPSIRLSVKY